MKVTSSNRLFWVLLATILGSAVVFLDSTVVNLALPKIADDLHADFSELQWITDGYLLSLSALILLGGSLGDIFGRKKVYLFGLVGFGVTSLLCAISPNATMLIVTRVIQGIFGALLVPGALSIINTNFGRELRGQAIGRWTAWTSIFFIIGPLIGGLILGVASWRWIFLINIPLIAACLLLALPSIEESKDIKPRRIDYAGALLAALALAGSTYGLIEGPAHHWAGKAIGALVAGLVLSVVFVWYESKAKDPMVSLSLFKSRNFSGSNLMTFAMYGALAGFTFALVIYLQTGLQYSSLEAGLSLLPVSIIMFFFAGRVGKLSSVYGPRRFMTAGPIIAGLGIGCLYFLQPGDSYLLSVLPGALLFSAGLVLTVAPLTTTVMTSVDETSSGIASGINNAVSRAAGLIVIAGLGLLGANQFYHFSMALCSVLAIVAGLISYAMIEKKPALRPKA
jgi:EmrB/QacA subfamily drug resistance transporter